MEYAPNGRPQKLPDALRLAPGLEGERPLCYTRAVNVCLAVTDKTASLKKAVFPRFINIAIDVNAGGLVAFWRAPRRSCDGSLTPPRRQASNSAMSRSALYMETDVKPATYNLIEL